MKINCVPRIQNLQLNQTHAPIGAWKCNFPPFQKIIPDQPTARSADGHEAFQGRHTTSIEQFLFSRLIKVEFQLRTSSTTRNKAKLCYMIKNVVYRDKELNHSFSFQVVPPPFLASLSRVCHTSRFFNCWSFRLVVFQ